MCPRHSALVACGLTSENNEFVQVHLPKNQTWVLLSGSKTLKQQLPLLVEIFVRYWKHNTFKELNPSREGRRLVLEDSHFAF